MLEERLFEVDLNETRPLFLGCSRRDQNQERATILRELDTALEDLGMSSLIKSLVEKSLANTLSDQFVARSCGVAKMPPACSRIVSSLQNWVYANGSLAREETDYLEHGDDLFGTINSDDGSIFLLQQWIERLAFGIYKVFGKASPMRSS